MDPTLVAAGVAFVAGYAVGALPVAWLVVRRRHGVDLRSRATRGGRSLDAAAVGGVRTALLAGLLEVVKGAAVGVAARLYSPVGWFVAVAIAGCVAGDAFPVWFRRGGRGVLPLVSGLAVALPFAGLITALTAIPAAIFTSVRGRIFDAVVVVAVPVGLLVGTRQWQSLVPAAIIVGVLLGRSWVRRRRRGPAAVGAPAWRMVIDTDPTFDAMWARRPDPAGQNPGRWDS